MPPWPVRGMSRPLSAGCSLTLSGVSPCAICQRISPLSRSIALIRPYGGLPSGSPRIAQAAARLRPPRRRGRRGAARHGAAAARRRSAAAGEPRAGDGVARDVPHVGEPRGRRHEPHRADGAGGVDVGDVRFRIVRAALPVRAAQARASAGASGPSILLTTGGVNIGPIAYFFDKLTASARSSGVKSIRVVDRHARALVRRRLGRGRAASANTTRRARRLSGPGVPRSARSAGRSRGRTRTARPASSAARRLSPSRPLTVMSARIGAQGMSMSQMPWWTSW